MELLPRREMRSRKTRQPKDMKATLTPLSCCSRWQPKAESTNAVILRSRTDKVQAASNHRYQPKTACGSTWLAKELEWGHIKSQHAQTAAKEITTYCQKPQLQPGRASRMRETTLEMAAAFRLGMSSGLHLVDKYSFSTGRVLACNCSSTSAQVWMAATSINCVGSPSWMKEQRVFKCDCPFGVSCKELSANGFLAGVSGCCFKDSRSFWISSTNLSSFWRLAASRFFFCFLACEDEDEEEVEEEDVDRFFFFLWVLRRLSLVVAACEKGASSDLRLRRPCPWSWWSCRRRSRLPSPRVALSHTATSSRTTWGAGRRFAPSAVPP